MPETTTATTTKPAMLEHDARAVSSDDGTDANALDQPAGHGQLQTRYNLLTLFCIGVTSNSGWEGAISSLYQSLVGGGPTVIFWGHIIASVGGICMAATIAEFASIWPTAAGQYHWSVKLAPPSTRRFMGWLISWCVSLVMAIASLSTALIGVTSIQGAVSIAHPTYMAPRWQAYLILLAIDLVAFTINVVFPRMIHYAALMALVFHVIGFLVISIVLLATAPYFNSAETVFAHVLDSTGYHSDGVGFLVGMLPTALTYVALDIPVHFAEETKNPRLDCSRAVFWGAVATALIGLYFNLAVSFSMGDPMTLLANPIAMTSSLAALVMQNAESTAAAIVCTVLLLMVSLGGIVANIGVVSRILMAQARDNAMPYGPWLSRLHSRFNTPHRVLALLAVIHVAVGTIYIGNSTAFYSIMSAYAIGMMFTIMTPVVLHIFYMDRLNLTYGPWQMPKILRRPVNIIAVLIYALIFVAMLLPQSSPVNAVNTNYACVFLGGIIILSTILWFVWGTRHYSGPLIGLQGFEVAAKMLEGDNEAVTELVNMEPDHVKQT